MSLVSLVTPLLLLSLALSGVCALINMELAPRSRVAYKRILFDLGVSQPTALLREKTFIKFFPGYIIYADKVSGTNLTDLLVCELDAQGKERRFSRAARGRVIVDRAGNTLRLVLQEAWIYEGDRPVYGEESELPPFKLPSEIDQKLSLSNMTFLQLLDELRDLERRLTDGTPAVKGTREQMSAQMQRLTQLREELTLPIKVHLHRQLSFSFACLGFMLVGIPLGIRAHRRETSAGIAMAIVLVVIYYSFFILGLSLETRPEFFPHLILWLPNFLFQSVGGVLLWRANRGV